MVKIIRNRRIGDDVYFLVLTVTNKHIKSQIIDKVKNVVLVDVSTNQERIHQQLPGDQYTYKTRTVEAAALVAKVMAEHAMNMGLKQIRWSAPGRYGGRIKTFIDTFREKSNIHLRSAGLKV